MTGVLFLNLWSCLTGTSFTMEQDNDSIPLPTQSVGLQQKEKVEGLEWTTEAPDQNPTEHVFPLTTTLKGDTPRTNQQVQKGAVKA